LRAKSTLEALARDPLEGYFHSVSVLNDSLRKTLYSRSFLSELQGYEAIEVLRTYAGRAPEHPISRVQYFDMKTYLVGDILAKVDRASMAHSLEVRVPILDHELVEWLSGLPPQLKLRGREGKYIFKKALKEHLPEDILYRPKMGFAVPLASWFRGPLRHQVQQAVLGPLLQETGIFNIPFLLKIVEQHQSGVRDYGAPIWCLLMFQAFLARVIDNHLGPTAMRRR
jgi:asparagine synthase (glutamine-hydrolysing)